MAMDLLTVSKYWEENLPKTSRRLKRRGKFVEHMKEVMRRAEAEEAEMVKRGLTSSQAMELAYPIAFPAPEAEVAMEEKDWEDVAFNRVSFH